MELRVRETGQIITDSELRSLHPNTSFPKVLTPEILESFGVDPILEGPHAQTTPPYEISVRQGIEEINGKWFTKYVVGPIFVDTEGKTAEEQEIEYKTRIDNEVADRVRTQRNKLLSESDWTQNKDVTLDNYSDWTAYRQELRDITTQDAFPYNVIWPTKPG
jgi:hypothetical protein